MEKAIPLTPKNSNQGAKNVESTGNSNERAQMNSENHQLNAPPFPGRESIQRGEKQPFSNKKDCPRAARAIRKADATCL
ncbi:hypothetical protein CEXT_322171 [Caerostris extrusa]|uniref:Uncharacterized protein n=1 Tax=Caerostris extrusa TaxID=172846 RepID=A0AAV4TKN2_CAEEX|nr:hypothetical protein CEXT_322171 [Caerostris extrusa]